MSIINNYNCEDSPIGIGGMGCVYRARNSAGRTIALKMLKAQYPSMPTFRTFFDAEARAISTLKHPSVVRIEGEPFADSAGNLYLPMEFVEGETIEQHIKTLIANGKQISEERAIDIMVQILDTFEYIHSNGKIHRDIKPSNIMLRPNGGICVIDFGIAKDTKLPTGLTIGHTVGTDGYMSPEQIDGLHIDHRTDIYSLGCLFYYMLTGTHAIAKKSNDFATRCAILNDDFPKPSNIRTDLSPHLEQAILKATDKNILRRYKNAAEFKASIKNYTIIQGAEITVGRYANNDIILSSNFVSGQHLTISYNESVSGPVITIHDRSTNGTAIDGEFVKHDTRSYGFNLNTSLVSTLPEVLLSGRPECRLDWSAVLAQIRQQVGINPTTPTQPPKPPKPPMPSPTFNKMWILVGILVIIILLLLIIN